MQSLNDIANAFVHHIGQESNKFTMQKGKTKILPEDLFQTLRGLNFTEEDIEQFRAKMGDFESSELVG